MVLTSQLKIRHNFDRERLEALKRERNYASDAEMVRDLIRRACDDEGV